MADADRQDTIILANAKRDSSITRGCGEAEATGVFAEALNKDPEFYSFQRSLESFRQILTSGTTIILPLGGFGAVFEQIREGVDEATLITSGSTPEDGTVSQVGSKCAEVSAAWYLASELNIDQPDLTLVSLEKKQWQDSTQLSNALCVPNHSGHVIWKTITKSCTPTEPQIIPRAQ